MLPSYWLEFIEAHHLVLREVSIPERDDLSGVGADIEILDQAGSDIEMKELYPGLRVGIDGYVAIGRCSLGTGDPYFIRVQDGVSGPLYRVYHDEVHPEGYNPARAVTMVLKSYEELRTYAPNQAL